MDAISTCGAIIGTCLDIGVEAEDMKRIWMDAADTCTTIQCFTSYKSYISERSLRVFFLARMTYLPGISDMESSIEFQTDRFADCKV